MRHYIGLVENLFAAALQRAFPEVPKTAREPRISPPKANTYGDLQSATAMVLFSYLKKQPDPPKNVNEVAQKVIENLPPSDLLSKVEVKNGGFINMFISPHWMSGQLHKMLVTGVTPPPVSRKRRVLVDFSSPNTAKDLHIGHLRSTVIGESVCRTLEYIGHDVTRINHIGDWGTQFGMLIVHLEDTYKDYTTNMPEITHLTQFYRAAKVRFDDPKDMVDGVVFADRARARVVDLQGQGNDPNTLSARKAWEAICAVSRVQFEKIYNILDITITERGESFYNSMIPGVLSDLEKRGILRRDDGADAAASKIRTAWLKKKEGSEEDMEKRAAEAAAKAREESLAREAASGKKGGGMALLFSSPNFPFPLIAEKRDGGYGYDSTDIAAAWHRLVQEKYDWVVYTTDVGQLSHFQLVWELAQKAGWWDPATHRLDHCGFGLVKGGDGGKIKTRSGDSERLIDVLETSREQELEILREREKQKVKEEDKFDEEYLQRVATDVGYSAIKYFDLKHSRTSDYVFSYEKMLDLHGDTAVFLLYSYVRIQSIARKVDADLDALKADTSKKIQLVHPTEQKLALMMLRFPHVVERAADTLMPSEIAGYLYDLAKAYNAFHRDCRVMGDELQDSRVLLSECLRATMKKAFDLLGVRTVPKL